MLATFDRLLGTLTLGVAGIAAISLAVAGILVMNVMLVSVAQRRGRDRPAEGARRQPAARSALLFLVEAALLSLPARWSATRSAMAGAWAIRALYPTLPAYPPDWAVLAGAGHRAGHRRAVRRAAGAARGAARPGAGAGAALMSDAVDAADRCPCLSLGAARRSPRTAAQLSDAVRHRGRHRGGDPADLDRRGHPPLRARPSSRSSAPTSSASRRGARRSAAAPPSGLPTSVRPLTIDDARGARARAAA